MEPREKINTIKLHLSIVAGIITGLIPVPLEWSGWFGLLMLIGFHYFSSFILRKKYLPNETTGTVIKLSMITSTLMFLFFWTFTWNLVVF